MIPNKVKIGGIVYDVKKTDKPLILDNKSCTGIIHYQEAEIELHDQRNEQCIEQTWWHEVIHGITVERGLDWGENTELYTDELAKGLYALMKDNKFPLPGQQEKEELNEA
jgi:hypothetical protein